jgi:hypothetical protein
MTSTRFRTGMIAGAVACLTASFALLAGHVAALRGVRDDAIPLAADVSVLERHADILARQRELLALQSQWEDGSAREVFHAYVLPREPDLRRALAFFDAADGLLARAGQSRSAFKVEAGGAAGATLPGVDGASVVLTRTPLTLTATLTQEGTDRLLTLLGLTGFLSVGDAFTPEQAGRLFTLTEAENYGGIAAVEQFLSGDFLGYVRDPRAAEHSLLAAFPSERFLQSFRSIIDAAPLGTASRLLNGEWGAALARSGAWPSAFLHVDRVSVERVDGTWSRVTVGVSAYGREGKGE